MPAPRSSTTPARGALRHLTLFTGSSAGRDARYATAVRELAEALAVRGVGVVYGGGRVGLMGEVADAALGAGGEVLGVMPQALVDGEIAHPGLTRLEVVADMHERKLRMGELGDGFVALPGGAGTLEELFEVWTWQQLGIHAKPVALYDVDEFWAPFLALLDHMAVSGYAPASARTNLRVVNSPQDLLAGLLTGSPGA